MREAGTEFFAVNGLIRRVSNKLRSVSRSYFQKIPVLCKLPWGGLWLTSNDVMSRHVRLHEDFEEDEKKFMMRFLGAGMTVLDLGAHHGYYTLLASAMVGPSGLVLAFEPSPRERKRLKLHLKINRSRNVRVEPFALGGGEGTANLFLCLGKETGCNSLRPPDVPEPTMPVEVSVTTVDDALKQNRVNSVDFIKLDVEGAEIEVLKGATALLSRNPRPVIICELADVRTQPWGYQSREIYDFLAAKDYKWFECTHEGGLKPSPRKDKFHENLVAVPEEKLALLSHLLIQ